MLRMSADGFLNDLNHIFNRDEQDEGDGTRNLLIITTDRFWFYGFILSILSIPVK